MIKLTQKKTVKMPTSLAPKLTPMKLKPTYRIPDQMKVKNIGVGWGGEKPVVKKVIKK